MKENQSKFKVWWDEKNGVVQYKHLVDMQMDQETAQEIAKTIDQILENHPRANLLINMGNVKSIPASGARKILSGLAKKYASCRIAFISGSIAIRVAINFIIRAAGHKGTKAFTTEEEALKWLKEK